MSVWMELRCEDSSEDHADKRYTDIKGDNGRWETSECWSHINSGCGQMSALASQKSVIENYKYICRIAVKNGWKRVNGNWVCPHCLKYKGKTQNKATR